MIVPQLDSETHAYSWIQGETFAPKFLGHVTENSRVIGFILEHIDNARAAGPADLDICRRALMELHALGIKHGDVNRHNFLVKGDGAYIIDFDAAEYCEDSEALVAELDLLPRELSDCSGKGGIISRE